MRNIFTTTTDKDKDDAENDGAENDDADKDVYEDTDTEADSETYKKALTALSEMSKKAVIYTKIPFNEQRKNVILLNEKISEVVKFQEDYKNTKTAIGDVNRLQKYDLIGVYD